MNTLERSLKQVTSFLEKERIPYMVVDGIANMIWGKTRLTQDLDITVLVKEEGVPDLIKKLAKIVQILPADPLSFWQETRVLPVVTSDRVRTDLIFARLPYEEAAIRRAKTAKVGKLSIKVCTAEDLIIHKIISERSRDLEDVEWIINRQSVRLDRDYLDPLIQNFSRLLERPEIWTFYLSCLQKKQKP